MRRMTLGAFGTIAAALLAWFVFGASAPAVEPSAERPSTASQSRTPLQAPRYDRTLAA